MITHGFSTGELFTFLFFELIYHEPKDTAEFEKSMELLCNKMLLFGHNDYMEFCNNIMETLGQNLYEEEHDLAQEEFTTKYGMFGEKLKTEEEIAREKREHTHRLYMMSDVPEYVEISGKWLAAEGELREYRDQCLKQGILPEETESP